MSGTRVVAAMVIRDLLRRRGVLSIIAQWMVVRERCVWKCFVVAGEASM